MTRTLLRFRVYSQSQSNPRELMDNTAREPSIEDHLTTHGHERFHQRILTVGPEGAGMRSDTSRAYAPSSPSQVATDVSITISVRENTESMMRVVHILSGTASR